MILTDPQRRVARSPLQRKGLRLAAVAGLAIVTMMCNTAAAADDTVRLRATNRLIKLGMRMQADQVIIPATARIADEDLLLLLDIGHFTALYCYCATVTPEGITRYLSKAEGLRQVGWHGPAVTDDVIAAMARLRSLESLDLRGPFRGTGLEALAKGPIRESLHTLLLMTDESGRTDHGIGLAHGLKPQAFTAIAELQQLRQLSLPGCGITDGQLEPLSRLQNLRGLDLAGNPINGSGLMSLEGCAQLEGLTLSFCRLTEYQLTAFPRLPALRRLDLSGNQIDDVALATVAAAEIPNLERLYLDRTDVTDAGLRPLRRFENLHRLSLNETRIDGSGLAALASSRIRTLRLARTPLAAETLTALSQVLHLRALFIDGTKLAEDSFTALQQLRQLKYLNVSRTNLSNAAIEQLSEQLGDCVVESQHESELQGTFVGTPGGAPATDY